MGNIQFRDDGTLHDWLVDRAKRTMGTSAGTQARVELDMWRTALELEAGRLRLTLGQACCLADVVLGTILDSALAASAPLLYHSAADAFTYARGSHPDINTSDISSYGAKWGIDEDALLRWLHQLTPTQDAALRDALSRWWDSGRDATTAGFATVGLAVVTEEE